MRPDAPSVTFTVEGDPVGWQRVGRTSRGIAYVPAKTRRFQLAVYHAFLQQNHGRFSVIGHPVTHMTVTCRFRHRRHPDPDNVLKNCLDALTAIAYPNDNRIASSVDFQEGCRHPCTMVTVR